jgi:hypothetical protein
MNIPGVLAKLVTARAIMRCATIGKYPDFDERRIATLAQSARLD